MDQNGLASMLSELHTLRATRARGRVSAVRADGIHIEGLGSYVRVGDIIAIKLGSGDLLNGEVVALQRDFAIVLPDGSADGIALGDHALLEEPPKLYPCRNWMGRVIDPQGCALDGLPLERGPIGLGMHRKPPNPVFRKPLGDRLATGTNIFNTLLPIVAGQRVGLFAGSGVGKTSLLGQLASEMDADVVVVALIGERGREVRHFVDKVIGKEGMSRCIVVSATSDQSALMRRQCAYAAMTCAEYFRDQGLSVLYLADSITRLAEAHREVAVAAGEPPSLRGHPASMANMVTSLAERAGPGVDGAGDITAVLSVLVAGSDMDEPVADTLRGVLDGHVVLDRSIAEGGRYPAVDVVKSVSRSLPDAATDAENAMIAKTRRLLASFSKSETMIRAGLYSEGADEILDQAVRVHDELENWLSKRESKGVAASFRSLQVILRAADAYMHAVRTN